jgi:hypothetical protein
MSKEPQLIYASSNGDRWLLVHDPDSSQLVVRHEPNPSSGGRTSSVSVAEFVARDGQGPQHDALRQVLASLRSGSKAIGGSAPLSSAQIRAGRALLGWTAERLARASHISEDELEICESGQHAARQDHLARIARALELGGVVMFGEGEVTAGGPGVRMGALGTSTGQPQIGPDADSNDNGPGGEMERSKASS